MTDHSIDIKGFGNEFLIGFSDAFIQCLPAGEKKQKVLLSLF